MRKICIFIFSLFILFSCNDPKREIPFTFHEFSDSVTYRNPVIKGFFPDPSICKAGDDYYIVNSSFEFFPGVPVHHSTDLVNWNHIGNALSREAQLKLDSAGISGGVWAPVIRYHEGSFYMITTNMPMGQNFYVTTEDPSGPWSDPVFIEQKNIDPSLFFDDDGTVYYTGTNPWDKEGPPGVYQAEIDIETGELLTEYRHIWTGTGGRYPEGPHLYKIGNWYYLMISEGGTETGHIVTIARSESPWGPFEECPFNPILTNRDQPYSNPVQNSGHADLIQTDDGKWWMVHLAVRNVNKHHHLGRETFLLPVDWDPDGWPIVNRDGVSRLEIHAVPPKAQTPEEKYGMYDFTGKQDSEWNYIRNPERENYTWNQQEGSLNLLGSEKSLDDLGSPTFIGIRQKDFNVTVTAKLSFNPSVNGEEAGIAVFATPEHYYSISKIIDNGRNYLQGSMKIGKIKHVSERIEASGEEVLLKFIADKDYYTMYFSSDGENWEFLGRNFARLLSSETAGTFTGVYHGMFASGNGKNSKTPAVFDFFNYQTDEK